MIELYQKTRQCRGCHHSSSDLRELFRMNPMPPAGPLNSSREIALRIPQFPLTLLQCPHCGLIQIQEILNPDFLIDKTPLPTNQFPGLVSHYQEFAELLQERYEGNEKVHLIEIGANDGVFLQSLPESWTKIGIDTETPDPLPPHPSTQWIYEPITNALVDKNQFEQWAHVVCLTSGLGKINEVRTSVQAATRLLLQGGEFWIEEPSFDHIIMDEQWDLLHHSQQNYWDAQSLQSSLISLGLEYIETFATTKNNILRHVFRKVTPTLSETNFDGISPYILRLKNAYEKRFDSPAVKRILEARRLGKRVAALRASRRTQVFLNQVQILPIEYIIDEVPQRQNHWIPGRGIPVVHPDYLTTNPVDLILTSHASEIENARLRFPDFQGEWVARFGNP